MVCPERTLHNVLPRGSVFMLRRNPLGNEPSAEHGSLKSGIPLSNGSNQATGNFVTAAQAKFALSVYAGITAETVP